MTALAWPVIASRSSSTYAHEASYRELLNPRDSARLVRVVADGPWSIGKYIITMDTEEHEMDRGIMLVEWGRRAFRLRHVLNCRFRQEGGSVALDCPSLGFSTYGATPEEAQKEFREEFAFLWDEYAQADDEELTEDALWLKRALNELVSRVIEK